MNPISRGRVVALFVPLAPAARAGATGTAFVSIIATGAATVTLTGRDGSAMTHTATTADLALAPRSSRPLRYSYN